MSNSTTHECKKCGKTETFDTDNDIQICCGIPMIKAPFCQSSDTAEHSRANDNGEPCNDGRAGNVLPK
jgi:hypothetical protein